jgi:hypothetical protein
VVVVAVVVVVVVVVVVLMCVSPCSTWGGGAVLLGPPLLSTACRRGCCCRQLPPAVLHCQVTCLTSPVAEMEYKAFHNLPWNDKISALLPRCVISTTGSSSSAASSSSPDDVMSGVMTFFAFNNPQPNQPSPGSITLYLNARGTWSGTVYQPPGQQRELAT